MLRSASALEDRGDAVWCMGAKAGYLAGQQVDGPKDGPLAVPIYSPRIQKEGVSVVWSAPPYMVWQGEDDDGDFCLMNLYPKP